MSRERGELQSEVFNEAINRLQKHPWFKGVCMDSFPEEHQIQKLGVDWGAGMVFEETAMWDCPTYPVIPEPPTALGALNAELAAVKGGE